MVGTKRAHQIHCWDLKLIVMVPNIKAFFHLTTKKMEDTLASHEIDDVDVNNATIGLVEVEGELGAMEMFFAYDEDFIGFQITN